MYSAMKVSLFGECSRKLELGLLFEASLVVQCVSCNPGGGTNS